MSTRQISSRRIRTVRDILFLILAILAFSGNIRPAQASDPQQTVIKEPPAAGSADLANSAPTYAAPAGGGSAPVLLLVDDNTSAAMIAAENAALTPPQFLVDLPVISR